MDAGRTERRAWGSPISTESPVRAPPLFQNFTLKETGLPAVPRLRPGFVSGGGQHGSGGDSDFISFAVQFESEAALRVGLLRPAAHIPVAQANVGDGLRRRPEDRAAART